jgi:large subunit ribosomal protein L14
MKAVKARITRAMNNNSHIKTCDNSGATLLYINTVRGYKGVKGRMPAAGVSHLIIASVRKGDLDMRHTVVFAVIVRQRKDYRRPDGMRIKFEDNAAVVCKDEKGNPKGTILKGPVAKEVATRWPAIAKLAKILV